jgi:putative cell wall-binding protein
LRRLFIAIVVAFVALASAAPSGAATLAPSQWPSELGLGSAPNAIRFGGIDRYATSLSMTLGLRGRGGYPFDTADRTSAGAKSLAEANGWWGAKTCPTSAIVVAGDTPADALAAAPLSDPTNRSDEPRLQRVAAADPLFDPIGGFDRVDTFAAPIIVTSSGRSGAHALAASARTALSDLARGGCASAREAIIVGGDSAVPPEVEGELVSLGYEEVFRVAGTDRFDTAARIATSLGTEAVAPGDDCTDEDADDGRTAMGFHGNAVIEYRKDASSCELRGRTVVLADGSIGADALAAGWWTSYWQVPVLLVAADGSLPAATRAALTSMQIDTIVVLGGTGRIPESVADDAGRLAGAVVGRFAGRDRYETSAIFAAVFGGWYAGAPTDFAGDRVCVAASSGRSLGWPDALAAGPWCGRLAADPAPSPDRAGEPVEAAQSPIVPVAPAHDAAPILLVPAGSTRPPDLLKTAFSGDEWCVGGSASSCIAPGYAVAFGGGAAISDRLLAAISAALAGHDAAVDDAPVLRDPFRTGLDLSPVYDTSGSGPDSACVERGSLAHARWLAVYEDPNITAFVGARDLVVDDTYTSDGELPPLCVHVAAGTAHSLVAISAGGDASQAIVIHGERSMTTEMSDFMHDAGPLGTSGDPGPSEVEGAVTGWRWGDAPSAPLELRQGSSTTGVRAVDVSLTLTRGGLSRAHTFVASVAIDDGRLGLAGTAVGEAELVGDQWQLAGRFQTATAIGGFRATLDTQGTADNEDDTLVWRVDGAASS